MKLGRDSKYAIVCAFKSGAQSSYNPPALGTNECQTLQEQEACQRQTLRQYNKISSARHVERWVNYMSTNNLHVGFQINDEPSWQQVPICEKHKSRRQTSIFHILLRKPLSVARSIYNAYCGDWLIAAGGHARQKSQRSKSQHARGF